jgi:6-phosphogluconolactonase
MDRRGRLEPIADSARPLSTAGTDPAEIKFSPDGRELVLTEKATNRLLVYEVGRDGRPEEEPEVIDSASHTPFGFDFGKHRNLFVSEAAGGAPGAGSVSSYRLTRDGGLDVVDAAAPTQLTAACWVVVTPDGRFVYTTNAGSSAITGFRTDWRGALTRLDADGVTASTGPDSAPIDMAISEDGGFLYALSARTGTISTFEIAADGSLVPLATQGGLPTTANGLAAH